jgi:hypothetical protein
MVHSIVIQLIQVFDPCRLLHRGAVDNRLLVDFPIAGSDARTCGPQTSSHPRRLSGTDKSQAPSARDRVRMARTRNAARRPCPMATK